MTHRTQKALVLTDSLPDAFAQIGPLPVETTEIPVGFLRLHEFRCSAGRLTGPKAGEVFGFMDSNSLLVTFAMMKHSHIVAMNPAMRYTMWLCTALWFGFTIQELNNCFEHSRKRKGGNTHRPTVADAHLALQMYRQHPDGLKWGVYMRANYEEVIKPALREQGAAQPARALPVSDNDDLI